MQIIRQITNAARGMLCGPPQKLKAKQGGSTLVLLLSLSTNSTLFSFILFFLNVKFDKNTVLIVFFSPNTPHVINQTTVRIFRRSSNSFSLGRPHMVYIVIRGNLWRSLTYHHKKDDFCKAEVKFSWITLEMGPCGGL